MTKSILGIALILGLTLTTAAQAGTHVDRSDCGYYEDREVVKAILDSGPWFNQFEEKLTQRPSSKSLMTALRQHLPQDGNVLCTFTVSKSGDIANLKIKTSSNSRQIDAEVLDLIRKAGPLPCPPNNLLSERGAQVELWKSRNQLYIWSQIERSSRGKAVSLIDYLGTETEHPWRTALGYGSPSLHDVRPLYRGSDGAKLIQ